MKTNIDSLKLEGSCKSLMWQIKGGTFSIKIFRKNKGIERVQIIKINVVGFGSCKKRGRPTERQLAVISSLPTNRGGRRMMIIFFVAAYVFCLYMYSCCVCGIFITCRCAFASVASAIAAPSDISSRSNTARNEGAAGGVPSAEPPREDMDRKGATTVVLMLLLSSAPHRTPRRVCGEVDRRGASDRADDCG